MKSCLKNSLVRISQLQYTKKKSSFFASTVQKNLALKASQHLPNSQWMLFVKTKDSYVYRQVIKLFIFKIAWWNNGAQTCLKPFITQTAVENAQSQLKWTGCRAGGKYVLMVTVNKSFPLSLFISYLKETGTTERFSGHGEKVLFESSPKLPKAKLGYLILKFGAELHKNNKYFINLIVQGFVALRTFRLSIAFGFLVLI